jgi:hypothetical protein
MRTTAILTVLALVAGACGSTDEPDTASAAPAAVQPADAGEQREPGGDTEGDLSELEAIGDVEVERGLLSVEVTIPADLAGEADLDGLVAEMAAEGISIADARRNPDGSVTYKMSRGDHRRLLGSLRDSFKESFEEVPDDFPSIRSITFNDDLTRFRMTVDRPAFENSFDGFVVFLPLFAAGIYAAFDGRDPEGMRIEIDYVDVATGQVYDTFVAPDDLQD